MRLPEPDSDARAHSARLTATIRAEIERSGPMPFARFMQLALYAPGLGYYSAGARKFGADGDFVTAPELGPLFARCTARAIAPVLRETGGELLELGAGSGVFAADALHALASLDALPRRYRIVEPSADLRQRQQQRLAHAPVPVEWLDAPPHEPWCGVLFANEVVDALPVQRFMLDAAGEVHRCAVACDADGALVDALLPPDAALQARLAAIAGELQQPWPRPYRSEWLPQLPAWFASVAGSLQQGLALFVDYGYPRREYFLPERNDGTLVCHYRHRAHGDPYLYPGLQDLTAFVDFTALAEAGTAAGFELACYASQAQFLLASGLPQELEAVVALPERERLARTQEAKRLTLPGEMGERFQVMAFTRGSDSSALPFIAVDRSERL